MSGSFVVRLRTPISVSMALLEYELSGLGLKALDEFVPSMRAVTKQDAWDFLKKNLQANKFVISAAGSHKQ
jgi:predicted Zn-dependent peptidase